MRTRRYQAKDSVRFSAANLALDFKMAVKAEPRHRILEKCANPGRMHIFDLNDDRTQPTLKKTLRAGEGAHHVAFTKDGRYGYVQNSFINLPDMSEGSITVVDFQTETVMDTINTFVENGFNPNCIVLLLEWNDPKGH